LFIRTLRRFRRVRLAHRLKVSGTFSGSADTFNSKARGTSEDARPTRRSESSSEGRARLAVAIRQDSWNIWPAVSVFSIWPDDHVSNQRSKIKDQKSEIINPGGDLGLGIGDCGLRIARPERMNESAKQSQFRAEVSSLKCDVSSSTPAHRGDPSRGRLGHTAADPSCETKPIWGQRPWDCGVRSKHRMCKTKPNLERMGCLGKRTLRAERLYDVAESAKQSQSPISQKAHRQASPGDATREGAGSLETVGGRQQPTWRAKQSQFKGPTGGRRAEAAGGSSKSQEWVCETKPI
jgi:hypothetical protein